MAAENEDKRVQAWKAWKEGAHQARPLVMMWEDPDGFSGKKTKFRSYYDEGAYTNSFGVRTPRGKILTPAEAFERYLTAAHSESGKLKIIMEHMAPGTEQKLTTYQRARIYSFVHNVTDSTAHDMLDVLSERGYEAATRYMDSAINGNRSGSRLQDGLSNRRYDETLLGNENLDATTSKGYSLRTLNKMYNQFVKKIGREDQHIALLESPPPSPDEVKTLASNIAAGKYDPKTANEDVRRFQMFANRNGANLDADGQAGKNTKSIAGDADRIAKLAAFAEKEQVRFATAKAEGKITVAAASPSPQTFASAKLEEDARLHAKPSPQQAKALQGFMVQLAGGERAAEELLARQGITKPTKNSGKIFPVDGKWYNPYGPSRSERLFAAVFTPEKREELQRQLVAAGFDLGSSGPKKDGVDKSFGPLTLTALTKAYGHAETREKIIAAMEQKAPATIAPTAVAKAEPAASPAIVESRTAAATAPALAVKAEAPAGSNVHGQEANRVKKGDMLMSPKT